MLAVDGSALAPQAFVYALDAVTSSDEVGPTDRRDLSAGRSMEQRFRQRRGRSAALSDCRCAARCAGRHARATPAVARRLCAVGRGHARAFRCAASRALPGTACSSKPAFRITPAFASGRSPTTILPSPCRPAKLARRPGACTSPDAAAARADVADAPRAAWLPADSELPFAPALLPCPRQPDRAGVFTLLLQRPGRRVRRLEGRFLWLRVELHRRQPRHARGGGDPRHWTPLCLSRPLPARAVSRDVDRRQMPMPPDCPRHPISSIASSACSKAR